MKKMIKTITSVLLCLTILVIYPSQLVASAADYDGKKYISDVKIGMGVTDLDAFKDLLEEGYTILKDDQGEYFDLNKDAGSKSILKGGPNQKIVYLGYKTTDNAKDAITDLAVMNMDGGYSYEDYEKLMQTHMDTQIKPFVDRFISTLNEYRENLQKPKDSANYKRANYYRNLLNKLTDDDTGNKPLGDLLVNKTKYEMGDDAYNKLSDTEKKNHCDILTLLMQGNGQAIILMETELTKASDSTNSTWIDRLKATGLDKLTEAVKEENPNMTPSEINRELDKRYNDDAKRILDKWTVFNEILINYDLAAKNMEKAADENIANKNIKLTENSSKAEIKEAVAEAVKRETTIMKGGLAAEDIAAHDYLSKIEYNDGTLLEFFERDKSEFEDDEIVRELYPIVNSLTAGQLAGLDFLSIKDMVVMALTDEKGFKEVDISQLKPASIYQDVNREIYEKGGVALTDAAMRAKATANEAEPTFRLSTLGEVLWFSTALSGVAAALTAVAYFNAEDATPLVKARVFRQKIIDYLQLKNDVGMHNITFEQQMQHDKDIHTLYDVKTSKEYHSAVLKSNICKYLAAGLTVLTAVLAGVSIYTTIKEMMDYYKVKFVPIPKYIVERADITATNEKGETVMIKNQTAYYKAALCNRTDGSSDIEKENHKILLDRNDLNGDVGAQWLSLYSVKYVNGMPILADSLKAVLGSKKPDGYDTGIHRFGEKNAFNLTSKLYCYNDPNDGTYVYFKNETATVKDLMVAGSVFSGGSLAIGAVIGLLAGAGITILLGEHISKKKKKTA